LPPQEPKLMMSGLTKVDDAKQHCRLYLPIVELLAICSCCADSQRRIHLQIACGSAEYLPEWKSFHGPEHFVCSLPHLSPYGFWLVGAASGRRASGRRALSNWSSQTTSGRSTVVGVFKAVLHADCLAACATRIRVDARKLLFAAADRTPRLGRRRGVAFAAGCMPLPDCIGILPSRQFHCFGADRTHNHTLVSGLAAFLAVVGLIFEVL